MNQLDLKNYTLSKNDKERLKDYTLSLMTSSDLKTKESVYARIRALAKILSDINEAKAKDVPLPRQPAPKEALPTTRSL